MIEGIVIWSVLIVLAVLLLLAIVNKKMSSTGNFAATSVFADMQNQEKRNAMETVIDEKAGKKRFERETGEQ
jgi:Na+-transporting methylmalonyl-CoA/oxaloacetate decarboxylase gamma subunit